MSIEFNCVVCFEKVISYTIAFKCDVCNDGLVCVDCYNTNWKTIEDRYGEDNSYFECEIQSKFIIDKIITCPCCRSKNWKNVYSSIFDKIVENFHDEPWMIKENVGRTILNRIHKIANEFTYECICDHLCEYPEEERETKLMEILYADEKW